MTPPSPQAELVSTYTVPRVNTGHSSQEVLANFRRNVGELAKMAWSVGFAPFLPNDLAQPGKVWLHEAPLSAAIELATGEIGKRNYLDSDARHLIEETVWSGACLANGLHRMRPIQIAEDLQVDGQLYPLLPYLNDIFALEFGWCTAFYWRRISTHAGLGMKENEQFSVALVHIRRRGILANEMFHQLLTRPVSTWEMAFFYEMLLHS